MNKYIVAIFIILDITGSISFAHEQNLFITKEFNVYPSVEDRIPQSSIKSPEKERYDSLCNSNAPPADWMSYFREMGVKWPDGSSIKLDIIRRKLIITNTPENVDLLVRIMGEIGAIGCQIEIELYFVEFNKSDISKLILDHKLTKDSLVLLWRKGKGELLLAPRIVTISGAEVTLKNVLKINPTKKEMDSVYNNPASNSVYSLNLATNEVGMDLSCIAESSSEISKMIRLTLSISIIDEPKWYTCKNMVNIGEEEIQHDSFETLFPPTQTIITEITINNGEILLLGGGMPSEKQGKIIYAFVTAQFVDMKGDPIKTLQAK